LKCIGGIIVADLCPELQDADRGEVVSGEGERDAGEVVNEGVGDGVGLYCEIVVGGKTNLI
jgi:hypothetical protein